MFVAYPIFLDLTGQRIVIIGGGAVAARKAGGVRAAGASSIKAVAPDFTGDFSAPVEKIEKCYEPTDLDRATLVFAATDSCDVNDAVVADARARGVWVNRADPSDTSPGDFITPAKFSNGPITVAVSAGSAALTTLVRKGLALRFDPAWATMAEVMTTLRPVIRDQSNLSPEARASVFRDLATDEAIGILIAQEYPGLLAWLRQRHPSLVLK